jgi:uncharacterized protein (TIGR00255 family)
MHSMTGFGRGSATTEQLTASVELSGVNRKQPEVVVQGVRDLGEIENRVRQAVLEKISRGRLQVTITLEPTAETGRGAGIDVGLAASLDSAFAELSSRLGREVRPTAADFLRVPGVVNFSEHRLEPESCWAAIEPALREALVELLEMRRREGSHLVADIEARIGELESLRRMIGELAPARAARYRELLMKRLVESGLEIDPDDERVTREIALVADRCDISEELTRLDSHFEHFRGYLNGREAAGRPLDFLCQELNREFNTIGSKSADAGIAQHIVGAKTEVEKIREQVQNLE